MHLIFYRDGVGASQRHEVISKEVKQFREAINEIYNKAKQKPKMTIVIVNKRTNQKFFASKQGQYVNPPSGTLIDDEIVEETKSDESVSYDFYMVPQ